MPNKIHDKNKPDETDVFEFKFGLKDLLISKKSLAQSLGYVNRKIPQLVEQIIEDFFNLLPEYFSPNGSFKVFKDVAFQEKGFVVNDVFFNAGEIIAGNLNKSSELAFFAVTAGSGLDSWSNKMMAEDNILFSFIIDTAGSDIAEMLADTIENKISEYANKKNCHITNRYSPGYCGWNLNEQKKFFSLLPVKFCGITLTDSSLMIPIKSVSGVVGIGENVVKKNYQCSICEMENCFRRKIKKSGNYKSN